MSFWFRPTPVCAFTSSAADAVSASSVQRDTWSRIEFVARKHTNKTSNSQSEEHRGCKEPSFIPSIAAVESQLAACEHCKRFGGGGPDLRRHGGRPRRERSDECADDCVRRLLVAGRGTVREDYRRSLRRGGSERLEERGHCRHRACPTAGRFRSAGQDSQRQGCVPIKFLHSETGQSERGRS